MQEPLGEITNRSNSETGLFQITKYVEREVINQSNLHHPHIVGFREVFLTMDYLAIVLEYVPGGNVLQYILSRNGLIESEVIPDPQNLTHVTQIGRICPLKIPRLAL